MQIPYYVVLYMQSVRIMYWFICKVSVLGSALYAKCLYYVVLYMQMCPYYVLLYMQSVLMM